MPRRWTAAIAAGALGTGLVLGAVVAAIGGTGSAGQPTTTNGIALQCDVTQMQAYMTEYMAAHMGSLDMTEMMSGTGAGMMGSGMMGSGTTEGTSSGMTSGQHAQHHGMR